ncbi:MAG: ATP-binding protein, partial [Myxococcota bacterium]
AAEAAGPRRWVSRPRRRDLDPGTPGAMLYVADDGPGVPEADRERIFDPFFTTKPPGQGTGLGLSTAARLAEEMEGALLLVEPPPGFSTAFALRLPVAPDGALADAVRGR